MPAWLYFGFDTVVGGIGRVGTKTEKEWALKYWFIVSKIDEQSDYFWVHWRQVLGIHYYYHVSWVFNHRNIDFVVFL